MNRYLNGNPLQVLLEDADPAVRYLVLRDIAGESGTILDSAYSEMRESPSARNIISSEIHGILGDISDFTSIGNGSAWMLALAVSCGLDRREPLIEKTVSEIFSRWQTGSGGIAGRWKPRHPDACLTGEMLRIALAAGISDERTSRAAAWILGHQRTDGGWLHSPVAGFTGMAMFLLFNRSGAGLSREADSGAASCIVATAACAAALTMIPSPDVNVTSAVKRAAGYLLSKRLVPPSSAPVTPFNSNLDPRELATGYPVFCQYDMLYGLLCVARAGLFNDPRTGEPFNSIMMRQTQEGIIPFDNYAKGMRFSEGKETQRGHDRWSTLNFLRVLKSAGAL